MGKNEILDWVEYAGKIVTWIGGAVRSFPVKDKKTKAGQEPETKPNAADGF